MTDKKTVEVFLKEVLVKKYEQLMAIELDLAYWKGYLTADADEEDKLRDELAKENAKKVVSRKGQIMQDERDMDKVANIQLRLEELSTAKKNINELSLSKKSMERYIAHVKSPKEELTSRLTEIYNL